MKFLCHRLGPASRGIWRESLKAFHPICLLVGTQRSVIHKHVIVIDKHAIPCKSDIIACFDELFKAHFVFGTSYNQDLVNVYNFLQTTLYEIDVDTTKVKLRVAELRSQMLH
jgi:hypothetical protein